MTEWRLAVQGPDSSRNILFYEQAVTQPETKGLRMAHPTEQLGFSLTSPTMCFPLMKASKPHTAALSSKGKTYFASMGTWLWFVYVWKTTTWRRKTHIFDETTWMMFAGTAINGNCYACEAPEVRTPSKSLLLMMRCHQKERNFR